MSVSGIGIDIVEVERIEMAIKRFGRRFLERVYTEGEIEYCNSKKYPYPSFAVRFAAKEAFFKAIGRKVGWRNIEVVRGERGRPFLKLNSPLDNNYSFHLSLSHTKAYAVAMVVMEEKDS